MLKRPGRPVQRQFLDKVFKVITNLLGVSQPKAPTIDLSGLAAGEANRAAAEATRLAQERAAQERASSQGRAASVLDDADGDTSDLSKRRRASIL